MENGGFPHLSGAFEHEDGILRQPWPYPVNDIPVNHVIILMDDHEKINSIIILVPGIMPNGMNKSAFYGGTALRMLYKLDRFSYIFHHHDILSAIK